jgi:hypothetical protein
MNKDQEQKMIKAHMAGITAYNANGKSDMAKISRQAKKLYETRHEREAYVAGYIGAQRRANKANPT